MNHWNRFKKVVYSSGIYLGTHLLGQALPFFLVSVLTRFLTPGDYGILATFQAVYPMGETFVNQGSTESIVRNYFDDKHSSDYFGVHLVNATVIKLFFLCILSLALFLMRDWLSKTCHFPMWLIFSIPFLAFVTAFINMAVRLWIVQKKAISYSVFQCVRVLASFLLTLLLVVVFGLNWSGRVAGIMMVEIAFMLFCFFYFLKRYRFRFEVKFDLIKQILIFGVPLVVYGAGHWIINLTDRFFLNAFFDVSTTGVYSVGYAFASIIEMIAGAFGLTIFPLLYEKLGASTQQQKKTMVQSIYVYFGILLLFTSLWVFISPYILKFFIGKSFHEAQVYIPWVSWGFFAHALFRIFSIFIAYTKKTYIYIYCVALAAIVNVILNYVLIKANGPIGAAQSTLISFCVKAIVAWYFAQKVYPMPWFACFKRENFSQQTKAHEIA